MPKIRIDEEQWAPLIRWMDTPVEKTKAQIRPLFGEEVSS